MRKLARRALTAAAAVSATIALTAVPAFAASFTAANNGNVVLADSSTGAVVVCTSSALTGDARIGPVPIGTSLLDIASAGFPSCTMGGNPAIVTSQNLPWSFIVDSYSSGGVTNAHLTGTKLHLEIPSIGCTVEISSPGDVSGTYSNVSSILHLEDYDLEVQSAMCLTNYFNVGDSVALIAEYQL
ncbi:hypothetical protein SAMN05443665_101260 [Actinomadura meyerae]|uniref:Secreted protein n=1 Tax=Actinomadura meyerae TaxID=240840 RepID=A0A239IBF6_9ACTN|nr:hypothetical protein [Actinomadura meyerae]SNS91116.1 hypothetical protein SAMN05443665_101260 [Actinomadura meyerae]